MSDDHVRLAGKAHVIDVIRAVASSPEGMSYSRIHFTVVRTSATSRLLQELEDAGLVVRELGAYRVTTQGRDFLQAAESLAKMKNPVGTPVREDYRRRRSSALVDGPALRR